MCWDKFIILYSLTKYHLLEIFFKVAIFSFLLEIDSQGSGRYSKISCCIVKFILKYSPSLHCEGRIVSYFSLVAFTRSRIVNRSVACNPPPPPPPRGAECKRKIPPSCYSSRLSHCVDDSCTICVRGSVFNNGAKS